MNSTTFKNKQDIETSALVIAELLENWRLRPHQWMIGKQMSFYFSQIIANPKVLIRDTNVYVLYKHLPWQCKPNGRLIFPPKNSKYAEQYFAAQRKHHLGIDLMPLPDEHLGGTFISQNKLWAPVQGRKINFESIEKFIFRSRVLSKYFLKRSLDELRNFYFADEERYRARLRFYARIRRGITSKRLQKEMDQVTRDYKTMMHLAYPEIFEAVALPKAGSKEQVLTGKIAFAKEQVIKGEVMLYNQKRKYQIQKDKPIFVFSHFYPADACILPLAKAIITEGGGLLCHAAIVCREQQVPCLVGVRGLLKSVNDGQTVIINFKKGEIEF